MYISESSSPVKDYSSLISPRNQDKDLASELGKEEKRKGGRTSKLVRFIDRKRRSTEGAETKVRMVEDIEPRQGSVIHVHHHYEDLKVEGVAHFEIIAFHSYLCNLQSEKCIIISLTQRLQVKC